MDAILEKSVEEVMLILAYEKEKELYTRRYREAIERSNRADSESAKRKTRRR